MKKEYIKPEMLVEEVLLEGMLAASVPFGDDNEDAGANRYQDRRGSWGNLWDQDEN